jgi:N-acetylneuraminate synthase
MSRFPKYIAEVSSNHDQDLSRIIDFIDASADIGCDAVKFQLFQVEKLFSADTIKNMPAVMERKKWELPLEFMPEIKKRCVEKKILLGCTPFYLEAVDELAEFVDFYKVASYELLWLDLIEKCAQMPHPLIISTGMANMDEIRNAHEAATKHKKDDLAFLHCESSYPVKVEETNLAAIKYLKDQLGCHVGWSDHSRDLAVILRAALKWDAEIFEFHLDLDSKGAEYSSGHCWLPAELANAISLIEIGKHADGVPSKFPGDSESHDRNWRADPSDGLRPLKVIREMQI